MKADELYARLSEDFEIEKYEDAWGPFLELSEFINPAFKKRWIGVMLDNALLNGEVCVYGDDKLL